MCVAANKDTGAVIQTGHGAGKAQLEIQASGQWVKNTIYGSTGQIEVHVLQVHAAQLQQHLHQLVMFGVALQIQPALEISRPLLQLMQTPQQPKAVPPRVVDPVAAFTTQHFQKLLAPAFSHWDMFGVAAAVGAILIQQVLQLVV